MFILTNATYATDEFCLLNLLQQVADCILALAQIGHHDTALFQRSQKRQMLRKGQSGQFQVRLIQLMGWEMVNLVNGPRKEKN